jgi:transcriptional antiterminator RfaH
MPLLPLEAFVYPPQLFERETEEEPRGAWWALHVKPRAEKALARDLLNLEHAFFLPLSKRTWRSRGRSQTSYGPLFPGYLFLQGDDGARLAALQTNRVVHALPVPDGPQLRADLARIFRLLEVGLPIAPEERLQPGMPVVLTAGPLAGLQGKVLRRDSQLRFVVEVDFIQRGASVQVEAWMLEPSASPAACPALA